MANNICTQRCDLSKKFLLPDIRSRVCRGTQKRSGFSRVTVPTYANDSLRNNALGNIMASTMTVFLTFCI
ncbi:hypothetical protein CHS0354_007547 [Potamilus streckersoni]|uniref:Uncharacterized protein n=1 Tax=Potamilus streckersoni TaxID=2493646 RepID=A0AAE0RM34_9BIVA|nr:hypothetical protein CHS0354_007547 [Potamilus streckersoni]